MSRATLASLQAAEQERDAERAKVKRLTRLVRTMIDNNPLEYVADGGVTVLDVWRSEARAALRETGGGNG